MWVALLRSGPWSFAWISTPNCLFISIFGGRQKMALSPQAKKEE
jgi:hypothetical protein